VTCPHKVHLLTERIMLRAVNRHRIC
jgi:hypothetical protein